MSLLCQGFKHKKSNYFRLFLVARRLEGRRAGDSSKWVNQRFMPLWTAFGSMQIFRCHTLNIGTWPDSLYF